MKAWMKTLEETKAALEDNDRAVEAYSVRVLNVAQNVQYKQIVFVEAGNKQQAEEAAVEQLTLQTGAKWIVISSSSLGFSIRGKNQNLPEFESSILAI